MRITVIGPRSVGKSTISKLLAERLGLEYLESDSLMSRELTEFGGLDAAIKAGKLEEIMKRGPRIVSEALTRDNVLLDLAGGAISSRTGMEMGVCQEIISSIKSNSFIVGLLPYEEDEKSINLLINREKNREHFKKMDIEELEENTRKDYLKVKNSFENVIDSLVYVGDKTSKEIVEEVLEVVNG